MSIIIIRYVPHIPIRILCRAVKKLCGKGTDIDIFCIGVIIYNGDLVDDTIQNNMRDIDLTKIIEDVVHTYQIKVKNVGGTLITDLRAENSMIHGDQTHLTNVIFNLLDNALKYRREEVPLRLEIATKNDGEHIILSIEDNASRLESEPAFDIDLSVADKHAADSKLESTQTFTV